MSVPAHPKKTRAKYICDSTTELAPPAPSPAGECCPPPPLSSKGGGDTLAYRRGYEVSQFGQRDRHTGTLGIVLAINHSTDSTYKAAVNL